MQLLLPILATFSKGDCFWIIMLIALLGGAWPAWSWGRQFFFGGFILWILIALMGWAVFGPPMS